MKNHSMSYSKDVKELVKFRLMSSPSNIKISIGSYGEFTKSELIEEIERGSEVGNAAIRMELLFIQKMPVISKRLSKGEDDIDKKNYPEK